MAKKRLNKAGLPPGTLVFLGDRRVETPAITIIAYSKDSVCEVPVKTPAECRSHIREGCVTWINITGLHDTELIRQFGESFDIHALTLEDILNTGQRPKFEDHGKHLFLVLRMLYHKDNNTKGPIISEQVSMLFGQHFVLTFQEMEGDVFDTIRNRIRTGGGRIRQRASDYLAYALLDAIVDNYFTVLETLDEDTEAVQQAALDTPETATLRRIHVLKRELVSVRRQIWPLREAVSALQKSENPLLSKDLAPYLHDAYEHTFQVIDTLESMREMIVSSLETYMSSVSNRMNEIMKVLTIISTIFIPLTFVAGVYGMNFEHMPELKWPFGYAAVLAAMGAIAAGMIAYFKRKSWF